MGLVYIERRSISPGTSLSWDIAHHLSTRPLDGSVLVIAERPVHLLASLRKQWIKVIYQLQREQSSILSPERKRVLKDMITAIQAMQFSAKLTRSNQDGILFAEAAILPQLPNHVYHTVYATAALNEESRTCLASLLTRHGLLVEYSEYKGAESNVSR